ncbi:MAG: tyrosine-type recombinase/integrase [Bacteroidales bacterium]|nr:tyrosine-type recombinase/integrase [Bacteroidales bacterium]MEE0910513.1 tyrosine-type recombinase/integrase [Bacteroidales bacterium]MEE1204274.1 tyrosine-type recombinase/integrase [Bacteroidales bacterium]
MAYSLNETTVTESKWRKYLLGFKSYILMERSYSVNTLNAYLDDCNKFFTFMEREYPNIGPQETELKHLQHFLEKTVMGVVRDQEQRILKVSTQRRIISGVRAFFKYLIMEDLLLKNPCDLLENAKMEKNLPVVLSDSEINRMLDAVDKSTFHGYRNALEIEILYSCGLRISELLNLKTSDIYWTHEYIKVLGKGNKERLVPIGESALRHLRYFIDNHLSKLNIDKKCKGLIFLNHYGRQLTRQHVFQMIKDLAKEVGINKNIHPHTLRHSFATELIRGGANLVVVKDMMGHQSILSTEIYTHVDINHLRETIMLYHPLYNKKAWQE